MKNSEWEKFNERIGKKLQRRIDQDELNELFRKYKQEKNEIKRLELKYQILERITPIVLNTTFKEIASLSNKKFKKMVEEAFLPIEDKLENMAADYLEYETILRDPLVVIAESLFSANSSEKLKETLELSLSPFLDNKKVLQRIISLLYIREIRFGMVFAVFRPFFDTLDIARRFLGVDEYWVMSIVALNLEENLLKKKLSELGLSKEEIDQLGKQGYYRLVDEVVKFVPKKEGRQVNLDVLLSNGYRRVRNIIDHEGYQWKPNRKDFFRIVGHLIRLTKDLWPQEKSYEDELDKKVKD